MPFNPSNLTRVTLLMRPEKVRELKKRALDLDTSLSRYLVTAGTVADPVQMKASISQAGVPEQK